MEQAATEFIGAKVMLFAGSQMIILRRDHIPGISWPGCLDFPGGGREGDETAADCALRETMEETGLRLDPARLQFFYNRPSGPTFGVFFAYHGAPDLVQQVRFGGEGAGWNVMTPQAYIDDDTAIPHFAQILRAYLDQR